MVSCMISVDFLEILGNGPAALAGPGTGGRRRGESGRAQLGAVLSQLSHFLAASM